jgi:hypothetical protein
MASQHGLYGEIEAEFLQAAVKVLRSRKPTRKAFYLGQLEILRTVMVKLVGEKEAMESYNRLGFLAEGYIKKNRRKAHG